MCWVLFLGMLLLLLTGRAFGAEELLDAGEAERALPETAAELMEGRSEKDPGDLSSGILQIISRAAERSGGAIRTGMALCCQILAVVILTAVVRGTGGSLSGRAVSLAGALAVGGICAGRISGFFSQAADTVDAMAAFSGFLFSGLATLTAATGAAGTSGTLYGVTVLICGILTRAAQRLIVPGTACYMALSVADSAVEGGTLKPAADLLRQGMTSLMKFGVLGFTAYLSLTGVVGGSVDSAAVKAAKLTISSAVPVVGSMVADASETLLVSASVLRGGLGVFGLLGVLAVSVLPFLETGCQYLMLKLTAAAAGAAGEKELSALIGAMAGAMGLLTGLVGACAAVLMVACVCFMKVSVI